MKRTGIFILALTIITAVTLQNCSKDEEEDGIAKFAQSSINLTIDDLSDVTVDLTIDPPAPKASNIVIALSGAEDGTIFTTTPTASSGQGRSLCCFQRYRSQYDDQF